MISIPIAIECSYSIYDLKSYRFFQQSEFARGTTIVQRNRDFLRIIKSQFQATAKKLQLKKKVIKSTIDKTWLK